MTRGELIASVFTCVGGGLAGAMVIAFAGVGETTAHLILYGGPALAGGVAGHISVRVNRRKREQATSR